MALSEYTWRSIQADDIPAIHQMLAASRKVDKIEAGSSEESLRQMFALLGKKSDQFSRAAFTSDGHAAAFAFIYIPPGNDEQLALYDGSVHIDRRGQGLGSSLVQWAEARVRREFSPINTGKPAVLRTSCAGNQTDRITLFEQSGFTPARYSYTMERSLAHLPPETALPEGVNLARWTPDLDRPLMEAFNAAFSEQWGLGMMNPDSWQALFTGVPQFRGDLTYLALDGKDVGGFCVNWVTEVDQANTIARVGWIEAIGVIPAWRGRGIASALLSRALHLFQAEGLGRAALEVDTDNPTGALRLYQKLGFEIAQEEIHFAKQLN